MEAILTAIAVSVLLIVTLALIIVAQRRFINRIKLALARAEAAIIIQRKRKNEHASEIKQIIMDNRMQRISQGKRTPTQSDIDWIKHHAPIPPAPRIVRDDDSLARRMRDARSSHHRTDDSSIYGAASAAAYSTPSSNYDSGDSCSSPSSSPGGSCD